MESEEKGARQGEVEEEPELDEAKSIPTSGDHGNPLTSRDTGGEEGRIVRPSNQYTARDMSGEGGWDLSPESKTIGGVVYLAVPPHPPAMAKIYMWNHRLPSAPTSPR